MKGPFKHASSKIGPGSAEVVRRCSPVTVCETETAALTRGELPLQLGNITPQTPVPSPLGIAQIDSLAKDRSHGMLCTLPFQENGRRERTIDSHREPASCDCGRPFDRHPARSVGFSGR